MFKEFKTGHRRLLYHSFESYFEAEKAWFPALCQMEKWLSQKAHYSFYSLEAYFYFFTLDQSKLEKSPVWFAREIIGAPTQKEDAFQTYDLFEGEVFQQRLNVESSDSFLDVLYDGLRYFEQLKKDEIASTWRIRLDLDNVGNLQKSLVFPQLYLEVFKK